ncbi:MAG: adenosine kinase [Alphaproteobacteria bacterium]|nr:adenosine kinase [Alphaproteobacteria bacterium]
MKKVVGIGNALIDVFVDGNDAKLKEHGLTKGTMHLARLEEWVKYAKVFPMTLISPGGSVCNSFSTLAQLGLDCRLIAVLGKDSYCETIKNHFSDLKIDVENVTVLTKDATGRSLIIITPDGERTMVTHLGACARLNATHVSIHSMMECSALILEGYLISGNGGREALSRGVEIAHVQDITSVLTLSDSTLVKTHREDFIKLLNYNVDILFGNLHEYNALLNTDSMGAVVSAIKDRGQLSIITNSENGSVICQKGKVIEIPPITAKKVINTTGAGDQYLAGFIAAHLKGTHNEAAGHFASVLGSAAVEQISAIFHRDIKDIIARIT